MSNCKKVFLKTMAQRRSFHIENLKARYKGQIRFVENLDEAEILLCVGLEKHFASWEELKAQELGIPITYFNDELLPEQILQNTLHMENIYHIESDEIAYKGEEL